MWLKQREQEVRDNEDGDPGGGQISYGLVDHKKEFGFYSVCVGKLLKVFDTESDYTYMCKFWCHKDKEDRIQSHVIGYNWVSNFLVSRPLYLLRNYSELWRAFVYVGFIC